MTSAGAWWWWWKWHKEMEITGHWDKFLSRVEKKMKNLIIFEISCADFFFRWHLKMLPAWLLIVMWLFQSVPRFFLHPQFVLFIPLEKFTQICKRNVQFINLIMCHIFSNRTSKKRGKKSEQRSCLNGKFITILR